MHGQGRATPALSVQRGLHVLPERVQRRTRPAGTTADNLGQRVADAVAHPHSLVEGGVRDSPLPSWMPRIERRKWDHLWSEAAAIAVWRAALAHLTIASTIRSPIAPDCKAQGHCALKCTNIDILDLAWLFSAMGSGLQRVRDYDVHLRH